MKYIPLHCHTATGSVGDSVLRIPEFVARAKEYGLSALAVTDHGSLSMMYAFAAECRKQGIRPLIGMEAYVVADNTRKDSAERRGSARHLVLLAKDNEGLKNLIRIHNNAATEGYYYVPRTDHAHLKKWGRGLIALSACVAGEIPQAVLQENSLEEIEVLVKKYRDIFGEDFYLEIQPGAFKEQLAVNDALVYLHGRLDVPLVVTNDIHYLNREDYKVHDYHVKLQRKKDGDDFNDRPVYPDTCYWFMDYAALKKSVVRSKLVTDAVIDEAVANARKIADSVTAELPTELHFPKYPLAGGETEKSELCRRCYARLNEIKETIADPEVYADRLEYELSVIEQKGFCGYFLIVQDYVNHARENNISVGPGRGSAAGSLVSYLLGIVQADPIQNGLMFERFLDPERDAVPDIDVDFLSSRRKEMQEYIADFYGLDCCALISTLQYRKAKGAIRDAARILGYEPAVGNIITKLIPAVYYGDDGEKQSDLSIADSLKVEPELVSLQQKYPDVFELGMKLEGLPSGAGLHAAGVLISPVPLTDNIPIIVNKNNDKMLATSLLLDDAEIFGLKFDFLALATLDTMKEVEDNTDFIFDFQDESLYEDDAVWRLIGSADIDGIFQISSYIYKKRMPRLKPHNLSELAICIALLRGPSLSTGMDEKYIRILEGKDEVAKVHPIYDELTKDTKGILVFQEQIMKLAAAYGMDVSTGYKIVKLGTKKKMDELAGYREEFCRAAATKNCDRKTADYIFDMFVKSAEYSFNRSHAISYAQLTYATAYYKVHFPLEFTAAYLSDLFARGRKEHYAAAVRDAARLGVKFLPPDINYSGKHFMAENNCVRVGLCAVTGLGNAAQEKIIEGRKECLYTSFDDFMKKTDARAFNIRCQSAAIMAGLFDGLEGDRINLYLKNLRDHKKETGESFSLNGRSIRLCDCRGKRLQEFVFGAVFPFKERS